MVAFIQNVGAVQLGIILLIVFILFGAGRLPQVFEAFGKAIKSFRDAQRDDAIDVSPKQLDRHAADSDAEELREKEKTHAG